MKPHIPDTVFSQHIAVLGKTGSGKSSVLRLFVEQLLDEAKPVCIIDPKGDWWGLKSSASGKSAGYPVVIFGGEHGDVPLNAHSGTHVAELIATGNRPCIIDLGGWTVADRTRFFIDFAGTMFRTTRGNRFLVIDEVHNFAPQGKIMNPEAGKMLHWANRLASEGRGKGLTIMSASQRPQKVHKDFLTCSETLVAMRVIHPLDRSAIKDWIDGAGDPSKGREVLDTLASMKRGEAWVWSPEIAFGPERLTFPLFRTYDSFAAQANSGEVKLKGWASVDLDEVRDKLAAVVEEAKANDPAELKKQIAELKRQKPAAAVDHSAIDRAVASAVKERDAHWQKEVAKITNALRDRDSRLGKIESLAHLNGSATIAVEQPPAKSLPLSRPIQARSPSPKPAPVPVGDFVITKKQQQILNALAWYESLGNHRPSNIQVGAVALIDATGGYWSNTVGPLSTAGLVNRDSGYLSLTDEGRKLAEPMDSAATLDEYHDVLRARVRKMKSASNKTIAVLDAIISRGGQPITNEEIGAAVGIDPTGGYFSNTIGPLGTVGLIERNRGVVTPTEVLFPRGL